MNNPCTISGEGLSCLYLVSMQIKTCKIGGCNGKHHAKGLCISHRRKQRLYGDPLTTKRPPRRKGYIIAGIGYIPLANGMVTKVDSEDMEMLTQWNWQAFYSGNRYYASRSKTFIENDKRRSRMIFMHRYILEPKKDQITDHINGDSLDNRRSNLRVCTYQQNNRNQSPRTGSSSYKGVHFSNTHNRWVAKITVDRKSIHIGEFAREKDAAIAYNKRAQELFGEFAYLNDV